MNKLSVATILNAGSIATFAAFPCLYTAVYDGGAPLLTLGIGLMMFSMITPFIALLRGR